MNGSVAKFSIGNRLLLTLVNDVNGQDVKRNGNGRGGQTNFAIVLGRVSSDNSERDPSR